MFWRACVRGMCEGVAFLQIFQYSKFTQNPKFLYLIKGTLTQPANVYIKDIKWRVLWNFNFTEWDLYSRFVVRFSMKTRSLWSMQYGRQEPIEYLILGEKFSYCLSWRNKLLVWRKTNHGNSVWVEGYIRKYALLHTIAWPLTKDSTLFVRKCISSDMFNLLALIVYLLQTRTTRLYIDCKTVRILEKWECLLNAFCRLYTCFYETDV